MNKCLVIGAAMLDIIMEINRLPNTGEDIYASSQSMHVGGCAYNVSNILGHCNVENTLFAPVGQGMYGTFIAKSLEETNQISPIHIPDRDNGYCLCMVEESGERTFITVPGIECEFRSEWFQQLDLSEYDSVYVSGYEIEGAGGEAILTFLESHRELKLFYAPGPRITYITPQKTNRIHRLSPILHLNEKESLDYTQKSTVADAATALFAQTGQTVIITMGSQGAYLYENGAGQTIASHPMPVIDTIGAGDAHIGTIIAMYHLGYPFHDAVQKANKVSGLVVGEKGATLTKAQFRKGGIL